MNEINLKRNKTGSYKLRVSLFLGRNKKRRRIDVGLHTCDLRQAQYGGFIILRMLRLLGVYERPIPKLEKILEEAPGCDADLCLIRDNNESNQCL